MKAFVGNQIINDFDTALNLVAVLKKILKKTTLKPVLCQPKVDLVIVKSSCKCSFEAKTCVILRAETLSDPLGIKKKNNSYCNWSESLRAEAVLIGSCSSEKGEVVLFAVPGQEAEVHRGEPSCSVTQPAAELVRVRSSAP